MGKLPLEGIRVVDLTQVWAGPRATKIMADMGAQVIKVEALTRLDSPREAAVSPKSGVTDAGDMASRPYNLSPRFHQMHRNKLGITLDLTTKQGVVLLKKLVSVSDVVMDNFRKGVLKRLGLDYAALRAVRPDIIVMSMPGFGESGPWSNFAGYGVTVEGLVGLYGLTGYADGGPTKSGANVPDPLNAHHAVGATLAALWYRRRTGKGQFIDFSHFESLGSLLGDYFMEYSLTGRVPPRSGNHHLWKSPHACFRCRGEDSWIAISVGSDEEWGRLCLAMERPDLADDPRFSDALSRWKNGAGLTPIIEGWTSRFEHFELMHKLQAAGITAAAVAELDRVFEDPQLRARRYFETVDQPVLGPYDLAGVVAKLSKTPGGVRHPAPCLGEHNTLVLGEMLGLSGQELDDLEQAGIIGTLAAETGPSDSVF